MGPCPGNTLSRHISPAHPLLQFQLWPQADVAWVAQVLPQVTWSLGHLQALDFESMWLKLPVPGKPFSTLTIKGGQQAIARENLFQKTGVYVRQEH